jgi:hypothetical protein
LPKSKRAIGDRQLRANRQPTIAIAAMARKLLIALWRYVETGMVPAGAEIRAVA